MGSVIARAFDCRCWAGVGWPLTVCWTLKGAVVHKWWSFSGFKSDETGQAMLPVRKCSGVAICTAGLHSSGQQKGLNLANTAGEHCPIFLFFFFPALSWHVFFFLIKTNCLSVQVHYFWALSCPYFMTCKANYISRLIIKTNPPMRIAPNLALVPRVGQGSVAVVFSRSLGIRTCGSSGLQFQWN